MEFASTDSPGGACRLHQRSRGAQTQEDSPVAPPAPGSGFGKDALALSWESLVAADSGFLK